MLSRVLCKTHDRIGYIMNKVLTLFFLLLIGYLVVNYVGRSHPEVQAAAEELVQQGVVKPLRAIQEIIALPLQGTRLSDWIPQTLGLFPRRRYVPNPYGYGGLDPAGGERKGGNGLGIPQQVDVGWWTGQEVTYPERRLSPVQDEQQSPPLATVAEVGWWGDDWM